MASRVNNTIATLLLLIIAGGAFTLLVTKHYEITQGKLRTMVNAVQNAAIIGSARAGLVNPCNEDATMRVFSPTVYICDEEPDELVYDEIYNLYPASADGRETIYRFLNEGEKSRADEMVEDIYDIERYEPVTLDPITWTEDPFEERYWRFLFYSLRPLRHLLATAEETGSERYYEQTREILESFIDEGMDEVHAWDDSHGVAFRTMVLTNAWWRLREAGELPGSLSDKILTALEAHGDFLLDPENYERDYNHAITQAAALLVLAESFPDLANATAWKQTAVRRIDIGLSSIIDPNGVLVENSPYYHFYVLEKYWEIYRYARENSIVISDNFDETISNMINFATYVLRPDNSVPLLGASSPRTFLRSGELREMAEENEVFDFVMTKGRTGERPEQNNVIFPSSGIAIFRSGWGDERRYEDETYVLFDTGPYRTDHSDLDALTFSLFAYDTPIIRDTGLYTYETEHPLYNYFYGTRGHNTVMIDGENQVQGSAQRNEIQQGDGFVSLAAWHTLYDNVRHSRTLTLIENNALLIVDDLSGEVPHDYEQLFHFDPAVTLDTDAATAQSIRGSVNTSSDVHFQINQLITPGSFEIYYGQDNPTRGQCAAVYENREPCFELSYLTQATSTQYITLIQFGPDAHYSASYEEEGDIVILQNDSSRYRIDIAFPNEGLVDSEYIGISVDAQSSNDQSLIDSITSFIRNRL